MCIDSFTGNMHMLTIIEINFDRDAIYNCNWANYSTCIHMPWFDSNISIKNFDAIDIIGKNAEEVVLPSKSRKIRIPFLTGVTFFRDNTIVDIFACYFPEDREVHINIINIFYHTFVK